MILLQEKQKLDIGEKFKPEIECKQFGNKWEAVNYKLQIIAKCWHLDNVS
jgi:hypothetical protein